MSQTVQQEDALQQQADGDRPDHIVDKGDIAAEVDAVLKNSLANPPTLAELAQRFYISRTKLCCDFREITGKSVGERLLELRLEEAKTLLTTTNQSIGQISHAVGYRFQSSFATAFSREIGRTPQQWRASHRHTSRTE